MSADDALNSPPWADRRARAARMLASGSSIERVSVVLGLSPATARRYDSLFRSGGKEALMTLGDVGRRRQLSEDAIAKITSAIKRSPKRQGLESEIWTNELVLKFIEREFHICYSLSHINRLIRDFGLQHRMGQRR